MTDISPLRRATRPATPIAGPYGHPFHPLLVTIPIGVWVAAFIFDLIEANRERNEQYAEGTLSAATALNPYIGYDKVGEIVKEAAASGRSLREVARDAGVEESVLDEALDYRKMADPHGA